MSIWVWIVALLVAGAGDAKRPGMLLHAIAKGNTMREFLLSGWIKCGVAHCTPWERSGRRVASERKAPRQEAAGHPPNPRRPGPRVPGAAAPT